MLLLEEAVVVAMEVVMTWKEDHIPYDVVDSTEMALVVPDVAFANVVDGKVDEEPEMAFGRRVSRLGKERTWFRYEKD